MLMSFFTKPERVLIYLCDASDGRAQQRQKLFKQWHENIVNTIDRVELNLEIEDDKKFLGAYGCMLTRKDFPHKNILQTELIDQASIIVLDKYGSQLP